jgi:DNA-binding NarL/FixJ family response regulator
MFTTLIVQDDVTFRQLLKEGLCARFPVMVVDEARNSTEALQAIEAMLPDLILVDARLQGENGFDLVRRIKGDHSRVPVLILTDYDLDEYREAARRSGADHFLVKAAWSWDEITGLVRSLLPRPSTSGELPPEKV